jgi:hypothetical protein
VPVAEAVEEVECAAVVLERLFLGVDPARHVARFQEVVRRPLGLVSLGEVTAEDSVRLGRIFDCELLEGIADAAVQRATSALGQAGVRSLLDEPMPETVFRRRPPPLLDDELEPLELRQRLPQLLLRCHSFQQRQPESAADHRGNADDLLRGRAQPVEPGLQRLLDEHRNPELGDADCQLVAPVLASKGTALDEVAQRLLEEERVAAGPVEKEVRDACGKLGVHDRERLVPSQRTELELAVAVRITLPGELAELPGAVLALGSVEEDERDRLFLGEREQRLQELEGCLVRPVEILQHEAQSALLGKRPDELVDGLEGLALDAVAGELLDLLGKVRLERYSEQCREEGIGGLREAVQVGETGFQLEASARLGIGDPRPSQLRNRSRTGQ